jgi:predicted NAD/FAD-dependent oxidoreductase
MAAFADETFDPGWDYDRPKRDDIDAVIWQASRPGRPAGSRVVMHASPQWSSDHLEADPDDVSDYLTARLKDLLGVKARVKHAAVHRWRYARVTEPASEPFGLDLEHGFATCGDWHVAPRVESAWLSGHQLGKALVSAL